MKFEQNDTVYFDLPSVGRGIGYISGLFSRMTQSGEQRSWIIGIEHLVQSEPPLHECPCEVPPTPKYKYSHMVVPESMIYPVSPGYFDSFKNYHTKKVLSESC